MYAQFDVVLPTFP